MMRCSPTRRRAFQERRTECEVKSRSKTKYTTYSGNRGPPTAGESGGTAGHEVGKAGQGPDYEVSWLTCLSKGFCERRLVCELLPVHDEMMTETERIDIFIAI